MPLVHAYILCSKRASRKGLELLNAFEDELQAKAKKIG
jgi:hypothetical protein